MSVDYLLHSLNKKPLKDIMLLKQKVEKHFILKDYIVDEETGVVESFEVSLPDKPNDLYEFSRQDDNSYWIGTNNFNKENFFNFHMTAGKIAFLLDFVVDNPQSEENNIDPIKFMS